MKKDYKTALQIVNRCLEIQPDYPQAIDLQQQLLRALKAIKAVGEKFDPLLSTEHDRVQHFAGLSPIRVKINENIFPLGIRSHRFIQRCKKCQ